MVARVNRMAAIIEPSHTISSRLKSNIPEMLLAGFGSFPALIQRFSVDWLIPSFFASSVPWMYLVPVIDTHLATCYLYNRT